MSEALIELLFWIVVFVALFFGIKKLQNRKKAREALKAASETAGRPPRDRDSDAPR